MLKKNSAQNSRPRSPSNDNSDDCSEESHSHHYGNRHNPHAQRCMHICALHGCHVPCVVDDGMPLDFHICYPAAKPEQLRSAAANPASLARLVDPRHVEQFRQLTSQRETGGGPATDAAASAGRGESRGSGTSWQAELTRLTRETFGSGGGGAFNLLQGPVDWRRDQPSGANPHQARESHRLYSPLTGRLLQAPSSDEDFRVAAAAGLSQAPLSRSELLQASVMSMLCRVLQTEDRAAVRAWLTAAAPRERLLVTDILRSAVANRDEYYLASPLAVLSRQPTPAAATAATPAGRSSKSSPSSKKADDVPLVPPSLFGSSVRRAQAPPTSSLLSRATTATTQPQPAGAARPDHGGRPVASPVHPAGRPTQPTFPADDKNCGGGDLALGGRRKPLCAKTSRPAK